MSGAWDRDLARDLDIIRDWGAAAIVTLLEPQELTLLRVERLGEEVLRRNMFWFHLPIVDVSIPDERFKEEWEIAGVKLRSILRSGSGVLVHCRGGLGRAGTIAARLLIELGVEGRGSDCTSTRGADRRYRDTCPGGIRLEHSASAKIIIGGDQWTGLKSSRGFAKRPTTTRGPSSR